MLDGETSNILGNGNSNDTQKLPDWKMEWRTQNIVVFTFHDFDRCPPNMAQKNKMAENLLLIFYIWMSRDFQNTEF